jgi:methylthioribose-1-phosphate isomerase
MSLEAIRYTQGSLSILDQLLLPLKTEYIPILTVQDAYDAIKSMQVCKGLHHMHARLLRIKLLEKK